MSHGKEMQWLHLQSINTLCVMRIQVTFIPFEPLALLLDSMPDRANQQGNQYLETTSCCLLLL